MSTHDTSGFEGVGRINLASQVYEWLLARIMHGNLPPDERLNIDQLARDLRVSVTPVRDALIRLSSQHLVQFESYKGYRVLPSLTEEQVAQLFEARMLIEVGAVRAGIGRLETPQLRAMHEHIEAMRALTIRSPLDEFYAVMALDQDFHRTLVAAAGNAFVADMYEMLVPLIHINRLQNAKTSFFTQQARIADEHAAIVAAYEQRDAAAAEECVRRHLRWAQERVDRLLQGSATTEVTA